MKYLDPLARVLFDVRFEMRLAAEALLSPEEKRRRLAEVDARAKRGCMAEIEPGDRFDVLEYPDDDAVLPDAGECLPDAGECLPSERMRQRGED